MNLPEIYHGFPENVPGDHFGAARRTTMADRLDFREIASIFRRRIKLFAIVTFVIFELALFITFITPNSYTAMSEIALSRTGDQVAPKGSGVVDDEVNSGDVDTEVQVLTSRELASKVVDKLKLVNDPTFVGMLPTSSFSERLKRRFGMLPPRPLASLSPEERARLRILIIDRLTKNIDVERVKTAFAMTITFTDTDPVRTAAIANAYAQIYAQEQVDAKRKANERAAAFLHDKIERLRLQAQRDMRAVQDYRVGNNLLSTTGASLTEQEISSYNQQVAAARAQAVEDAARLDTARQQLKSGSVGDDVGAALSSDVIHSLRTQRATISARVADLATRYGDKYPELADARNQLRDIDLQIQTEIFRVISNLDAQARVSQQRLDSLQASLGGAKSTLAQNNQAMVSLDDLTRRASTSQALYESYLDRYKTVLAQTGTESADSRILSEARIPGRPSSPIAMLNLILGLLIGAGVGAAAAIAAELFFTGFTTGDEVEHRLGLRYLGGVPALDTVEPREATPIATVEQFPRSGFAESFRSILGAVRHARDSRHGVIAISSALPGEGKSTLSLCLAAANAIGSSDRVIAIDCDITRHRLSDQFVTDPNRPGLREVLRDGVAIEDALIQVKDSNLFVLPITTPFDAQEQITRGGLVHALVARLREFFPLIILDCPPLLPVAEARDLAAIADDVILVAAWRKTKESALRSAIRLLPPAAAANAGVVLTRIDMKKQARFGAGDASSFYHQYKEYYSA